MVFSTSDTRWITRGLESYIDVWLIKDIDVALVKQGSMIKKIIKKNSLIDPEAFKCRIDEYLFYSTN